MNRYFRLVQPKFSVISLSFLPLLISFIFCLPLIGAKSIFQDGPDPVRLSNFNQTSLYPVMTSDANDHLHLFWRECTGFDKYENCQATTIYYRRWDGSRWQIPIDVFVAPDEEGNVAVLDAEVDNYGTIHVIWIGKEGFSDSLFHSWASVHETIDARSFQTELIDVGTNITYGDLLIDEENNVHVVFNESNSNIFYITNSFDDKLSASWSLPVNLSTSLYVEGPKIVLTNDGWMHITWTELTEEGFGRSIFYSRSMNGESWETPQLVFQPIDEIKDGHLAIFPNLGSDGVGRLHLVWSRGVGKIDGLYHSMSDNNGQTWSDPKVIHPGLSGSTGHNSLQTDSKGNLHLILSSRIGDEADFPDEYQGTYIVHSIWDIAENQWTEFEPLTSPEFSSSEHLRAAITEGNLIHVVWMQWINPTPIMYTNFSVDAPKIEADGYPHTQNSVEPEMLNPNENLQIDQSSIITQTTSNYFSDSVIDSNTFSEDPIYFPILLGTITAGLVIALITLFIRNR